MNWSSKDFTKKYNSKGETMEESEVKQFTTSLFIREILKELLIKDL